MMDTELDQAWQRAGTCRCNRHDPALLPQDANVGPIRWVHFGHTCPDPCESCGTTIAVVTDTEGRPRWMEVSITLAVDPGFGFRADRTVVAGATGLSSDEHTPARCAAARPKRTPGGGAGPVMEAAWLDT